MLESHPGTSAGVDQELAVVSDNDRGLWVRVVLPDPAQGFELGGRGRKVDVHSLTPVQDRLPGTKVGLTGVTQGRRPLSSLLCLR